MELGKKIRFNNKDWFVKLKHDTPFVQVFLYNENENISNEPYYEDWGEGDTIMDSYKNAVLKANKIYIKCHEYEDLQNWDGNMDKEVNHSYNNITEFYKSLTNELEELNKLNIKKTYDELQEFAKKIIKNCELEKERLDKGIAIIEIVRGDELI